GGGGGAGGGAPLGLGGGAGGRGRCVPRLVGSGTESADRAGRGEAPARLPYLRLAGADDRPAARPRHDGRRRDRPAAGALVDGGGRVPRLPRGGGLLGPQLV